MEREKLGRFLTYKERKQVFFEMPFLLTFLRSFTWAQFFFPSLSKRILNDILTSETLK